MTQWANEMRRTRTVLERISWEARKAAFPPGFTFMVPRENSSAGPCKVVRHNDADMTTVLEFNGVEREITWSAPMTNWIDPLHERKE